MNPSSVACGRCGASIPQDADFCETCGAFLAAYQAPAGATETVAALTQPAESTPTSETIYIPPSPVIAQPPPIAAAELDESDEALEVGLAQAEPASEVQIEAEEAISEPVLVEEEFETERTGSTVDSKSTPKFSAQPGKYSYTPPPSPPQPAPNIDSPIPAIHQAVFGKYAEIAYPADSLSGTGRASPSPHTLILIGVAALLGVCVAAMVASSNSAVLLLIGGPLAVSLIVIGVLMIVGHYPTGRP